MSNVYKFCGCRACRYGLHRKGEKPYVKNAMRKLRRQTKQALQRGKEPPTKVSIPYTD